MAKLLASALYWIGIGLYRAGDRILLTSERVQGDGEGPWSDPADAVLGAVRAMGWSPIGQDPEEGLGAKPDQPGPRDSEDAPVKTGSTPNQNTIND